MKNDETSSSHSIWSRVRETHVEPSPYLKTRVLAELSAAARKPRPGRSWLSWLAPAASFGALALGLAIFFKSPEPVAPRSSLQALVGDAVVVRLDVASNGARGYADISLPDDDSLEFVSKSHPEYASARQVRVALGAGGDVALDKLPFVIRARKPGVKDVRVELFGEQGDRLSEKTVTIDFKDRI